MIAVRRLSRDEWEARLRNYRCQPLPGKGPLNTAEWWQAPWGTPFTVPVEVDGYCDHWALQKLILDLIKTAPDSWVLDDP